MRVVCSKIVCKTGNQLISLKYKKKKTWPRITWGLVSVDFNLTPRVFLRVFWFSSIIKRPKGPFPSKVPKLSFSGVTIPFVFQERRKI